MSNILIYVDKLEYISDYRKAGVSAFLFGLSNYCVGYNTYTLDDIKNVEVSNKYLLINRVLDCKAIDELKVILKDISGIKGIAGQTNYSAAKGGLIAATKALAQEVARKNITVNAVAPGFIQTDMVEGLDETTLKKMIPANRFGKPEEVAELVGFLVSKNYFYESFKV